MTNILVVLLYILAFSASTWAALSNVDKAYISPQSNKLKNPGFENGKASWTASGGTFAISTTSPIDGAASATWDSDAADQTLTAGSVSLRAGNNLVFCKINVPSGTATHNLEAYDGANVIATTAITSSTQDTLVPINFVLAADDDISLRLKSVAADEPSIKVDTCYAGPADGVNIFLTMPQDVFSAKVSATGVVSDENENFINGNCTVNSAGNITCSFVSGFFNAAPNCSVTQNRGSASTAQGSVDSISTSAITYITANGSGTLTSYGAIITCQKTGVDAVEAVNAATSTVSWSGYHDADCGFGRTGTTYADPPADATCTFAELENTNAGTVTSALSGSDDLPGFVFPFAEIAAFEVCAAVALTGATTGAALNMQLIDGNGTVLGERGYQQAASLINNIEICQDYTPPTIASQTLKLQTKASSGSVTIGNNASIRAISWRVTKKTEQKPAPHIVNSVVSPSSGVTNICSGFIANAGTPSVTRSDGDCAASVTDNGTTGDTSINFASGTFSSAPNCVCSTFSGGSICSLDSATTPTSSLARIQTVTDAGAGVDQPFFFICIGPK